MEQVPHYRAKMEDLGIVPKDIHSSEGPRDTCPTGLLACDRAEFVCCHASSGTTFKPAVAAYTAGNLRF